VKRTEITCSECGETGQHAAHGLCFSCYRRLQRARNTSESIGSHNSGIRIQQRRVVRAFASVVSALSVLEVSREDMEAINEILSPYFAPLAELLDPAMVLARAESSGAKLEEVSR
jgi:NMD protein affecting ribosome stability and mRNA decay